MGEEAAQQVGSGSVGDLVGDGVITLSVLRVESVAVVHGERVQRLFSSYYFSR